VMGIMASAQQTAGEMSTTNDHRAILRIAFFGISISFRSDYVRSESQQRLPESQEKGPRHIHCCWDTLICRIF
jgi:hypothetical protein